MSNPRSAPADACREKRNAIRSATCSYASSFSRRIRAPSAAFRRARSTSRNRSPRRGTRTATGRPARSESARKVPPGRRRGTGGGFPRERTLPPRNAAAGRSDAPHLPALPTGSGRLVRVREASIPHVEDRRGHRGPSRCQPTASTSPRRSGRRAGAPGSSKRLRSGPDLRGLLEPHPAECAFISVFQRARSPRYSPRRNRTASSTTGRYRSLSTRPAHAPRHLPIW